MDFLKAPSQYEIRICHLEGSTYPCMNLCDYQLDTDQNVFPMPISLYSELLFQLRCKRSRCLDKVLFLLEAIVFLLIAAVRS